MKRLVMSADRYPQELQQQILDLVRSGLSYAKVEERLNLTKGTVSYLSRKNSDFNKQLRQIMDEQGRSNGEPVKYTPELIEQMLDLLKSGLIYREIEEKLALPKNGFHGLMQRNEEFRRRVEQINEERGGHSPTKYKPEVLEQMLSLLREGLTLKEIADKLGIPINAFYNINNKDFKKQVEEILIEQGRKNINYEPEILGQILDLLRDGLTYQQIQQRLNLPVGVVGNLMRTKKEFADQVQQILEEQDRDVRERQDITPEVLEDILFYVRLGYTITQAEELADVYEGTTRRVKDKEFKEKLRKILEDQGRLSRDYTPEFLDKIAELMEKEELSQRDVELRLGLPDTTIAAIKKRNPEFKDRINQILDKRKKRRKRKMKIEDDFLIEQNIRKRLKKKPDGKEE